MRVRVIGFNWLPGNGIFLQEFLQDLAAKGTIRTQERILGVIPVDNYWIGVMLTIKDQHGFAKMVEHGKDFIITAQQLAQNESPVDFNFFLINSVTGRGLYQHYFQSPGVRNFTEFARTLYADYKERRVQQDVKAGENLEIVRKKYAKSLQFSYWMKQQAFADLVKKLQRIKAVDVTVETDVVDEPFFRPLRGLARTEKRRFTFGPQGNFDAIATQVVKLANKVHQQTDAEDGDAETASVAVHGISEGGAEITINLENNVETYSDLDYDELINGMSITSTDARKTISESQMSQHLRGLSQSGPISAMLVKPQVVPAKKSRK